MPQGRTDVTLEEALLLNTVMAGDLGQVIDPLTTEHQANLLSELGDA